MGKIIKKGVKGAASNFITRQQALNKLQISLADFRRLCILKGIYPREPKNKKKANKGSTAPATFYYIKDIKYLLHEPLLAKFREYKAFAKKLNKVLHKGEFALAKSLEENNRPIYNLDHIVKERYPSFIDALRDLDDALSMLYLFSKLPADNKIKADIVAESQQLISEFQAYVMKTKSLRKVFFSIKGIYYQAEIKGQTITWIVPYQFSQEIPTDVDFRVMLTFLEFYRTLVGFVNFKLYNEINMTYPPKIDETGGFHLDENMPNAIQKNNDEEEEESTATTAVDEFKTVTKSNKGNDDDDDDDDDGTVTLAKIQAASNATSDLQNLFKDQKFYLSRETPRYALEFMIRSCGGQVSWDPSVGLNPPFPESDETIHYQITDRPTVRNRVLSRTYVQPQWIADCINARKILKPSLYEPGKVLPPHLSPFVEVREGDYVPETGVESEKEEENEKEEEEEEEEEKKPKKRTAAEIEEEEQKEMATVMMTNKQRKLYTKMQYGIQKKAEEKAKLEKKKKALKKKAKN
ncbi:Pescadillo N-terminus-domain-containing protein [Cokeromyces recurvatus]|uniref:Pescadillo N-terminus-domain-containing protein n=1 Tax=Cokeromyces recurvatus TaxID=90255 RepID=UPI00221E3F92|nr:Pescadillo N-terminus-domain-containing protein [Cokeromyces recurvatus]KAI7898330.1 Pescadillo N-terminus-domain-containing protein [Cokeromyces recurvatus]